MEKGNRNGIPGVSIVSGLLLTCNHWHNGHAIGMNVVETRVAL